MPTAEKICNECGKIFYVKESVVKRGRGKFCSRKCYGTSQHNTIHDVLVNLVVQESKIIETHCLVWLKTKCNGYGEVSIKGKTRLVHVVVFEHFRGLVPIGMQLHHRCENKLCANPDHLEILSVSEHVKKHNGAGALNALKTHCLFGHPLFGENLYIYPDGKHRACRQCFRDRYICKKNSLKESASIMREEAISNKKEKSVIYKAEASQANVEYFTPEDLALILRVPLRTIQRILRRGEMEALRVGSKYRISKESWEKYLQSAKENVDDKSLSSSDITQISKTTKGRKSRPRQEISLVVETGAEAQNG